MPILPDDSISPIVSQVVGASRLRSPAKLQFESRYGDSQRSGSAPRSSSGPKSRMFASAVTEANVPSHRGRYISKRKERRWDNDHLFGMDVDIDFESNQLSSDWQSNFRKLFKDANATELFRTCADGQFISPVKVKHVAVKTELTKASDAWNNVEGRLRGLVVKILERSAAMKRIVACLESIVVSYKHELSVGDDTSDGRVWKAPFTGTDGSVELLQSLLQSNIYYAVGQGASLAVPLVDNVSYRLLLHTVCQYHGLKSQTINIGNAKVTLVTRCNDYARSRSGSTSSVNALPDGNVGNVRVQLEACHIADGESLPSEASLAKTSAALLDCMPLIAFLCLDGKLSQENPEKAAKTSSTCSP